MFNLSKNILIMYAAIIYDNMNVIVRVERRRSFDLAKRAGEFWTKGLRWYSIDDNEEMIEMHEAMLNL